MIAAVATLVILVLIGRFTTWGKQFWRVTGDYFKGPDSVKVWLWLAVLLLSVIAGVRIDVLLSAIQGNDMMTSFQVIAAGLGNGDEAVKDVWQGRLLVVHPGLRRPGHHPRRARHAGSVLDAAVHAAVARLADRSADQTTGSTARPTTGRASSTTRSTTPTSASRPTSTSSPPVSDRCPTPPTTPRRATLLFGAISSITSMISFTAILWNLSGTLTLPFFGVDIPRAMFWIAAGLRALRDRHRVLDRQADHLAVLQQREVQRRVPLRAGAPARRVGGGRVLPGRGRRAHRAAAAVRAGRCPTTSATSTG